MVVLGGSNLTESDFGLPAQISPHQPDSLTENATSVVLQSSVKVATQNYHHCLCTNDRINDLVRSEDINLILKLR